MIDWLQRMWDYIVAWFYSDVTVTVPAPFLLFEILLTSLGIITACAFVYFSYDDFVKPKINAYRKRKRNERAAPEASRLRSEMCWQRSGDHYFTGWGARGWGPPRYDIHEVIDDELREWLKDRCMRVALNTESEGTLPKFSSRVVRR